MALFTNIKQLIEFYKNKNPYFLKRIFYNFYVGLLRILFLFKPHKGVKVMDEDWDYLLVLDACRFNVFKKIYKEFFNSGNLYKKNKYLINTYISYLISF